MIRLRRLNGTEFYLNADLIEQIESTPDTVITLSSGNSMIVLETAAEVTERVRAYRQSLLTQSVQTP